MEINLNYSENYFSSDDKKLEITKYDRMKLLLDKEREIDEEYHKKIKVIKKEIDAELKDHKHQYKVSFDIPPYNYGKVCVICGHTI